MGEPHVISALMEKRARILGDIADTKDRLAGLQDQFGHIDATLRIFGTTAGAEQKPVRTRPRKFQQGELTRLLFTLLRENGPQTAPELRDTVMERKGMSGDPKTRYDIVRRVGKALERQSARGTVRRVRLKDGGVVWELAG